MTDRLGALLATSPELSRASRLVPERLAVSDAFEQLLPEGGPLLGSTVSIGGAGATSLAMALAAKASRESWVAAVGLSDLGLAAASELGVDLNHLVVIPDPDTQWPETMSAVTDAFDVILTKVPQTEVPKRGGVWGGAAAKGRGAPPNTTSHKSQPHPQSLQALRKLTARVREQRAVLVSIGGWPGSDIAIRGGPQTWHGIGQGHGCLVARALTVAVTGRRSAARPRSATMWLPDDDGEVRIAGESDVIPLAK